MTHPIVEAVAAKLLDLEPGVAAVDHARTLAALVLRLAREPSGDMRMAIGTSVTQGPINGWRAGIDALLREVEG